LTVRAVGSTIGSMRSGDLRQSDGRDPGEPPSVVPIGPVVPITRPRALPLVVIVAILVGTSAFVAGLQLGATRPADTRPAIVPPAPTTTAVPASPSVGSDPIAGPPYASAFADAFRPPDLFARFVGGPGCVSHNEQTQEAIGVAEYVLERRWTTFCPVGASTQVALVNGLIAALSDQMPSSPRAETSTGPDSTLALFPYAQNRFVGTVSLSADAAGSGFQIVISLQERRAP
jgi:hypothetical protein